MHPLVRWIPVFLVLPTFAFILYSVWRYRNLLDGTMRPRTDLTLAEEKERARLNAESSSLGDKLRRLNSLLWLAFLGGAIVISIYNTWFRE